MTSKIKTIKNITCRMCESTKFFKVINLGNHPLVNSLIEKKKIKFKDPVFPIELMQCKKCFLRKFYLKRTLIFSFIKTMIILTKANKFINSIITFIIINR